MFEVLTSWDITKCIVMLFVTVYFKEEKQKYDHLLENAKKDLEVERQTVTQLRLELDEFRRKYEESQKEVEDLNQLLSSQRKADIQQLEEDRHKTEKIQKLREESSVFKGKLEEEKRKSEELLSQVSQPLRSLFFRFQPRVREPRPPGSQQGTEPVPASFGHS